MYFEACITFSSETIVTDEVNGRLLKFNLKIVHWVINPLNPDGNYMSHLLQQSVTLHCVLMDVVRFSEIISLQH
jgi:hypothetical protein